VIGASATRTNETDAPLGAYDRLHASHTNRPKAASARLAPGPGTTHVEAFNSTGQVHLRLERSLKLDLHLRCDFVEYDVASDSLLAARGWEAASRPKGVPGDWVVNPSRTSGGTRFVDPSNPHNAVRVVPGWVGVVVAGG
jgi:hypothetical protein